MNKWKRPKKGEVWLCNLGKNIGSEQNGFRPCVVLCNPPANERTRIILPSSRTIRSYSCKVNGYSFLLHHIRSIDIERMYRKLRNLDEIEMYVLKKKLFQLL